MSTICGPQPPRSPRLQQTGCTVAYPDLTVRTRVEDCPAEVTLVDASADAGLVVVGTRGRGTFEAMLLGSVSHAVIHGASCAVAVVEPEALPAG